MAGLSIILTVTNDLTYDQRMQRICATLAMAGYRVTLVGRQLPASSPLIDTSYAQVRLQCIFDKGKLFYIEYNLRLLWYLLRHRADIYCAIDLDTIAPSYIAARRAKAKIVYDAHEYFPEVPEVAHRPLVKRIWLWIERYYVPRVDAMYTVSQGVADIFASAYHRDVPVIRNVPIRAHAIANLDLPTSPRVILYQGALNVGRGLEQMIAAMSQIDDAALWLAGEGDLSAALRAQIHHLNLADKVKMLGYVAPDKLKAITASAYIGINLLDAKGLNYYHSLANKCFDYIQAAVPQVGMQYPEYIRLNEAYEIALLIPDLSPSHIIAAVQLLLKDADTYQRLRKNCLVCSTELTWENEQQRLLDIYAQLYG
jgi:glycosyltransferase involved in cell wall biosynthesis